MQYSRTVLHETYSTVEVILMAEVFKVVVSAFLSVRSNESGLPWHSQLWSLLRSGREMLLLVVLYTISNVCGFNATPLVGAAWHSVLVQLKILTTAVFGVCFLGRKYSTTKWRALLLLLLGAWYPLSSPLTAGPSPPPL